MGGLPGGSERVLDPEDSRMGMGGGGMGQASQAQGEGREQRHSFTHAEGPR